MLTLRRKDASGRWQPRVVTVSARANTGIDALIDALEAHRSVTGVGRRRSSAAAPSDDWRDRLAALAAKDGLCGTLGIAVIAGGPGRAEVTMTVDARHLNFNGGCHGGAIFALADSAFGLASNSHGPVASGIDAHITFQAAVKAGDVLVARAVEVQRSKRIGVYRIDVVRPEPSGAETAVSSFTGTVYVKA